MKYGKFESGITDSGAQALIAGLVRQAAQDYWEDCKLPDRLPARRVVADKQCPSGYRKQDDQQYHKWLVTLEMKRRFRLAEVREFLTGLKFAGVTGEDIMQAMEEKRERGLSAFYAEN